MKIPIISYLIRKRNKWKLKRWIKRNKKAALEYADAFKNLGSVAVKASKAAEALRKILIQLKTENEKNEQK